MDQQGDKKTASPNIIFLKMYMK
uniref:Uncharacterized protein n=1 Tax=Anguilla anguilla TaxID=7936 RepID=A0A0E9PFV7_ANGAN